MTDSLLRLIELSSQNAAANSGYFQAQVTGIESTTGRVYILRIDDEDGLPDEEPYTTLNGFVPEVGEWVMMANWGRTAVCLGTLVREDDSPRLVLASGQRLAWGESTPDGNLGGDLGSLYLRLGSPTMGKAIYVKTMSSGVRGWVPLFQAHGRRVVRSVYTYLGASTSASFERVGFHEDPVIVDNNADNADGPGGTYLEHDTTSSSSNTTSVVAGTNSGIHFSFQPDLSISMRAPATITSIRQWYGLFSSTPAASNDPAVHGMGFRFSTSAPDTNIMCWCNDGSGAGTITDSGVLFVADAEYDLRMISDADSIDYYINDQFVAHHTANLPGASTNIKYGLYCRTLTSGVRSLRWGRITLETS